MTARPRAFQLPALSGLDNALTANHNLEVTLRQNAFPPGTANGLVTTLVRTTESAMDAYERARTLLVESAEANSFARYMKGLSEMEICVTALDRAMRVAEQLVDSNETTVTDKDLPSRRSRKRLSRMRNAIDHVGRPVAGGRFGAGEYLFLYVSDTALVIHDGAAEIVVDQSLYGGWVETLHKLASALVREPGAWYRVGGLPAKPAE